MRGGLLRTATRSTFSAAGSVREPKDLHAAWASLAAYDSKAAGAFLNDKADRAKVALNAAGFELAREFVVHGGKARSFDGTQEVDETDAAYLWLRQADGRSLLAFRGSGSTPESNPEHSVPAHPDGPAAHDACLPPGADTQEDLEHVRNPSTCFMYGHYLHAGVAEREFAPLVGLMSAGDLSSRLG
jgi:hypothetical protein